LLFDLHSAPGLAEKLASALDADVGELSRRQFPDGESYLRFDAPVAGRDVILLCTLDRPDAKLAPLLFGAEAAKAQGARSVGIAAPYLAYMRQDKQFHPGEAITSKAFARLLSQAVDWLATIDPHLHRYPTLSALYDIPAIAGSAVGELGAWIRDNVDRPVIIGPDEESRQWVDRIASIAGATSVVLRKERSGDYDVAIDGEALDHLQRGTPVIVDDIASSARTLIETVRLLAGHGHKSPTCAVVHAIFAGDSYQRLTEAGVGRVASTNAVSHETNAADISRPLAEAIEAARAAIGASSGAGARSTVESLGD
jgi:ribose-phosphate pyrophosphokinase